MSACLDTVSGPDFLEIFRTGYSLKFWILVFPLIPIKNNPSGLSARTNFFIRFYFWKISGIFRGKPVPETGSILAGFLKIRRFFCKAWFNAIFRSVEDKPKILTAKSHKAPEIRPDRPDRKKYCVIRQIWKTGRQELSYDARITRYHNFLFFHS